MVVVEIADTLLVEMVDLQEVKLDQRREQGACWVQSLLPKKSTEPEIVPRSTNKAPSFVGLT